MQATATSENNASGEATTQTTDPTPPTPRSENWREVLFEGVVRAVTIGVIVVVTAVGLAVWLTRGAQFVPLFSLGAIAIAIAGHWLLASTWSLRWRAGWLATCLHLGTWSAIYSLGVRPGPVVACFICASVTAIFLSRRWAALSILWSGALLAYGESQFPHAEFPIG